MPAFEAGRLAKEGDKMTRRKDGLWQEVVNINGTKKYFYGKTKAEVLRKVNAYKGEQEAGPLFYDVADEWWQEHEQKIAYYTARSYKPAKIRAQEAFKNVRIKDILPNQISREIKLFSKTYADKTVRTQLMVYNLIFKYAVEMGYILMNPARDLSVPDNLRKKKVSAPPPDDIERVKSSTGCTFGLFAYWAMYTGMRRGELLALRWDDVDMENRTITVNKSVEHINNRPRIKTPKTKSGYRTIPILDKLCDKIKPGKGYVFQNADGGILTETQFQRQWELYCKESGVTSTPHQFRHAFATMLYENNVPEKDAQELLGHAQLSTTMDIYTDIREVHKKKIFSKVYSIDIE
jgi:integrase family protein